MNILGKTVTVTIDRPLDSRHPNYKDLIYPVNYGFIPDIFAADGEEQDAYVLGVTVPIKQFTGTVIAIVHRRNDAEDKWVVAPENLSFTESDIYELVRFQEQYFDVEIRMNKHSVKERK